jgi:hypothetical protein
MRRFGLMGLVFIGFVAGIFYVYSCGGGSSSSAAGTGSLFLQANDGSGYVSFPDAASTTYVLRTTAPADYVSGGPGDVTYSAVFLGGDNCNYRLNLYSSSLSFGTTGGLFIVPPAFTHPIPDIATGAPFFQSYLSSPSSTRTGFSDVSTFTFTRIGADVNDTCTGDLQFYGIMVEYPN